ncbi:hypothetical protein ACTTAI_16305 [Rhodobacter capsulatus]|uniref:hypothetical protein n=1 Tax=Rhodobacter capsulatus TaxID=1061 RepID=UPI00402594F4
MDLSASQLAQQLNLSRARISQLVSEGKLEGCYVGENRQRRFDLGKARAALLGRLDPGQMMGNGAETKRALREIAETPIAPASARSQRDGVLPPADPDRYELARIESAEQDARRKRRDNERDEGKWVLAEAAEREAARLLAREIAQFETVLRDAARDVADKFGADFREVRAVLLTRWRTYRLERSSALADEASAATLTDDERTADA